MVYKKYIGDIRKKDFKELQKLREEKRKQLKKAKGIKKFKRNFEKELAIETQIDEIELEIVKRKNKDYFNKVNEEDKRLKKELK